MKPGICLILCSILASVVFGADITLRNGKVLKDAEIASAGEDYVSIQYADGVTKVSYKELTDEQQKAYGMTPEEVKMRQDARHKAEEAVRQKAEAARHAAEEEAKKLRESMTEAERRPRYLQGHDVTRMFLTLGELSAVEAEVIALQWNAMEADRVGLPDEARAFRERAAVYNGRMKELREERKKTEEYWLGLEQEYQKLRTLAQKKINNLNNKVSELQGEVNEARREANTERIIVSPGVTPWWNPMPPPPTYRPAPSHPKPNVKPKPGPGSSGRPLSGSISTKSGTMQGVRPASVTPARPAQVTPARPAR